MNRELEFVRLLEPEIVPPSDAARNRQRALLLARIEAEAPVPRRRRAIAPRALAVAVAISALGGGAAFALSKTAAPDPQHVARVEQQWAPGQAQHVPSWRPEIDAERIVCDYQHVGRTPGLVYTPASGFPAAEPFTQAKLVDECRSDTDAVRTAPVREPALLCAITPPGEQFAVPAVTFGVASCRQASLNDASAGLLDERNRMRRDEVAIRAVPSDCPSVAEATTWVREQVAATGAPLRILPTEEYPEGQCWVPFVKWGRGEVRILALENDGSPGTLPPAAPPQNASGR
jgi:hypothetical protein